MKGIKMKKILSLALMLTVASAAIQHACAVEVVAQTTNRQIINIDDEISKLETQKQILVALRDGKNSSLVKTFLTGAGLVYGFRLLQGVAIGGNQSIKSLKARYEETFPPLSAATKTVAKETAAAVYTLGTSTETICCSLLAGIVYALIWHYKNKNERAKLEQEINDLDTQIEELKQEKQICSGLPFQPADIQA